MTTATEAPERGRLAIDHSVVEKLAAVAAAESTDVRRRRSLRGSNERGVQAVAELDEHVTSIAVTVAVRYPCDLADVVTGIRSRVTERVTELTGLTVRRVEVRVADFVTDH